MIAAVLTIAAGILLAFFVLAFLPEVVRVVFALFVVAPFVIGLAVLALFAIVR